MITKQLHSIHHCSKSSFFDNRLIFPSKSKQVKFEERLETYFINHPLVFWSAAIIGFPIGMLLAVGLVAAVLGLIFLGVSSFM